MSKCAQCDYGLRQQWIRDGKQFCTAINDYVDNCKFGPYKREQREGQIVNKKEPVKKKRQAIQPVIVYHDTDRPDLVPFGHYA